MPNARGMRLLWHGGPYSERPETNQTAYPGLVPREGKSGKGADTQRRSWLCGLANYVAAFSSGGLSGVIPININKNGDPKTDNPTKYRPVAGSNRLALAEFKIEASNDSPRPHPQHVLLHRNYDQSTIELLLDRRVSAFRWLGVAEAESLLQQAAMSRAKADIRVSAAVGHNAQLAQGIIDGTHDWRVYARDVMGLPMIVPPSKASQSATQPVQTGEAGHIPASPGKPASGPAEGLVGGNQSRAVALASMSVSSAIAASMSAL